MRRRITIGIAEDHDMVRHGLIGMLKNYPDIKVLFGAANGLELLQALKENQPAIILLDIAMPQLGGIKAMQIIKQHFSAIKIIVISAYAEESSVLEYVKQGANSFLPKDFAIKTLVAAIYSVYKHGSYFDENVSKLLTQNNMYPATDKELTERELTILNYLIAEKPYKHIAKTMHISIKTVDWYKRKLFLKTGSKNEADLKTYALKHNLG
jgi:DNA-binding NarL/FixJ family response regulator